MRWNINHTYHHIEHLRLLFQTDMDSQPPGDIRSADFHLHHTPHESNLQKCPTQSIAVVAYHLQNLIILVIS